jgi:nickel/cobalt transporter (NiCoT) family protein
MLAVIAWLHAFGFGILILVVTPRHFNLGSAGTFAIGTGITAYTLGLRHAFDADHIPDFRRSGAHECPEKGV